MSAIKSKTPINYIIRKTDNIGTGEADTDSFYQEACFIDTGMAEILQNPKDARCIILGRTGAGKTALLNKVARSKDHVIQLQPESLSLTHIYNSNLIRFFESIGTHLDLFYIFLWIHVISCECLKSKFNLPTKSDWDEFLYRYFPILSRDQAKKKGIEYYRKFGLSFWKETEERTEEFTQKLETHINMGLGEELSSLPLDAGFDFNLSKAKKTELVNRSKKVASDVHLNALTGVIDFLTEDVFSDHQNCFYVVIDGLDEEWAGEDALRYRLVKALIEAIRKFQKVPGIKIIITMRTDLYRKVIDFTKTTGAQEEKYEALLSFLSWNEAEIEKLLDERVEKLTSSRPSDKKLVTIRQLLSEKQYKHSTALKYILDRTFLRPREAILYVNECLKVSDGQTLVSFNAIRESEQKYSRMRLRSLYDEWRSNFPNLEDYVEILKGKRISFSLKDITTMELDDFVLKSAEEDRDHGPIHLLSVHYLNGKASKERLSLKLLHCLYLAGVIGVKMEKYSSLSWSFSDTYPLELQQLTDDSKITFSIHPTFWLALGVNTK